MERSPSDKAISVWLKGRTGRWNHLRELSSGQRDRRDESLGDVRDLAQGFRTLARDYSLARSVMPEGRLTRQLEALFRDLHEAVFRTPNNLWCQLVGLFRDEVPQVVGRLKGSILSTVGLFVFSGVTGWLLVARYPELAALFASEEMINRVQRGELWTDGLLNIIPSSLLSLNIMANNIGVALFAFAVGALYGLGTLYIIGLNGLMLGGAFAFTAEYHLAGKLFEFVVAHGVVELSVICLAGAAGVQLGEALARPGARSRADAFRDAVTLGGKLLPVCALFLVGAGLIEGYISPEPGYPLASRVCIGLGYGAMLWLVLSGKVWRGARAEED